MRDTPARVRLFSRRMPGQIILVVDGELTVATTARLRDQIAGIIDDATVPIVVDLSRVSYCDTPGLAMLVGAGRRAGLRGLTLAIFEPGPEVGELLCASGLDQAVTTYATVATACSGPECSDHPVVA